MNKMINLNVIKKAMFLAIKDKKLSLSNSAPWQNIERFHKKKKQICCYVCRQGRVYLECMPIPYNWTTTELLEIDEGISLTLLIFLTVIFNNNNNNNNPYIAPMSILLFSSALKSKHIRKKKKTLRLQKVYMQKVHEPTNKSENNFVNTKL